MSYLSFSVLGLCIVGVFILRSKRSKDLSPLPPAPPASPFIGHLLLIPPEGQDVFFYELGKTYGDIIHLKVLNQTFIILNSAQVAFDLIDRRSGNYRNRPSLPIFDMLGFGDTMAFLPDCESYRLQRKMLSQYFSKEKVKEYHEVLVRESRSLAQSFLSNPEGYSASFLRYATAVIIELVYGHQVVADDDLYVKIAEDGCNLIKETGPPGATPVDFFPILRHFPSWFPGTYYAEFARKSSWKVIRLLEYPFEQVKEQLTQGTARPSFLAAELESSQLGGKENDMEHNRCIQNAAAIAYIAGAETTSSTLSFFLLAMVLYPECQLRAQQEIDGVIGPNRLPEFSDRERLPYLECILQETSRWNHAVPTGVPRIALEDDVYNGMLIPKGSTVIANTRGITLDESVYQDPHSFDPSRFLPAPSGRGEPYTSALFGYGRRKCPGRYIAEESLWMAISTLLATSTISRAVGKDGKEIVPEVIQIAVGMTSQPKAFPFQLRPRTQMASDMLA